MQDQPAVSVDVLALRWHDGELQLALHRRPNPPYEGMLALPGVLLLPGESLADAVRRALGKVGLPSAPGVSVRQFRAFDDSNRDPRGATIAIAHFVFGADAAPDTMWVSATDIPGVAFDHAAIVAEAVVEARRLLWTDPSFTAGILPDGFTTNELLSLSRQIGAELPEPDDQKGHRKRRGSRGGRPVALDATDYKNRNVIERRYCHTKQWRGLATRYDKHAVIYRAAVVLNAVVAWSRELTRRQIPAPPFRGERLSPE